MGIFSRSNDKSDGRIDTLVAEAARITGDMDFVGGLHLDGRVTGNVRAEAGSAATLWVSEKGQVEGNIDVPIVVLNGQVRGDVLARDKLVLGAKARITGNVSYGVMEMAPGAQVSGKLAPISAPGGTTQAGPVALKALPGGFDGRKSAT